MCSFDNSLNSKHDLQQLDVTSVIDEWTCVDKSCWTDLIARVSMCEAAENDDASMT